MKRKLAAVLTALSILLSILPGTALAAESGVDEPETIPPVVETDSGEADGEEEAPPEDFAPAAEEPVPGVVPEEAPAADEPEETASLLEESADGYTVVRTEEELRTALALGQEPTSGPLQIRLGADIKTINAINTFYALGDVTLDLNGYTLSLEDSPENSGMTNCLVVSAGNSLTLLNGTVVCSGGIHENRAVSIWGGTLAIRDVTLTADIPLECSGHSDQVTGQTLGEITEITRCNLICTELPDGTGYSRSAGLEISGGAVGSITDTVIQGGYYGINIQYGSIESISSTMAERPVITGESIGIFVANGHIGEIANYEIIGGSETIAGISLSGSRIDSIKGCSFALPAAGFFMIDISNNGSVGLIEGNEFTCTTASDEYPCYAIQNEVDGTIDNLGAGNKVSGQNVMLYSRGTIKQITAEGYWDADMRKYTSTDGWVLFNDGIYGEPVKVSTEAELLNALNERNPSITLAGDITLSTGGDISWNCHLDLGGHTLTVRSPGSGMCALAVRGDNVYIHNGTVDCPDSGGATISVIGGRLNLGDVTVTGALPLDCKTDTRQIDGIEWTVPGNIGDITNSKIFCSAVPTDAQSGRNNCGIRLQNHSSIGYIYNSTIIGGYYGILLEEGSIFNHSSNSTISVSSSLAGACAIENSGSIRSLRYITFDAADNAAVRNRVGGIIYELGDNQFYGSNMIYNEGTVENISASGQWSADNKVFQADSGWTLVNSSGEGLPRLDTPTNLSWGDGNGMPFGVFTWQLGQTHQGKAEVKVYQRMEDGQVSPYPVYQYVWQDDAAQGGEVTDYKFLLDRGDWLSNGTYYFTVQVLGDYTQYESSGVAVSADWTYVRPEETSRMDIPAISLWDGERLTVTTPDGPDVFGCYLELLYSETLYGQPVCISDSFCHPDGGGKFSMEFAMDENLKACLNQWGPGYYRLRARTISKDITRRANSYGTVTVYYYYDGGDGGVEENLEIITSSYHNPEEIKAVLNNIGTDKLLNAMVQEDNASVMQSLKTLEDRMEDNFGVRTIVTADSGGNAPPSDLDTGNISMVGAALNAVSDSATVELKVGKALKEAPVLPTMYGNTVTFSMTMNGVENPHELTVPVQITMPVPEDINPDFLVVLHHLAGGSYEKVPVKIENRNDGAYAVFYVTGFSDYTMTEAASGVALGKLSVQSGGGTISVTTGELKEDIRLLVASYDDGGKMLGTKIITLQANQQGKLEHFALPTKAGGTVKAFAVKNGTMEPVCLAETQTVK